MENIKGRSHIAAILGALQLKGKPLKMAKFIRENKEWIPGITEQQLNILENENENEKQKIKNKMKTK
jgi:hypothetical protein